MQRSNSFEALIGFKVINLNKLELHIPEFFERSHLALVRLLIAISLGAQDKILL